MKHKKDTSYYYYIGHDGLTEPNETKKFLGYKNLQELANTHYQGNTQRALEDTEYVFSNEEYENGISEPNPTETKKADK